MALAQVCQALAGTAKDGIPLCWWIYVSVLGHTSLLLLSTAKVSCCLGNVVGHFGAFHLGKVWMAIRLWIATDLIAVSVVVQG